MARPLASTLHITVPPPPVFEVGSPDGLPLSLLKAAVVAQVESGDARIVVDLRPAGQLAMRDVGTLLYAQALCDQAGGSLTLRLTDEQRTMLAPHPALLSDEESAVEHPRLPQP